MQRGKDRSEESLMEDVRLDALFTKASKDLHEMRADKKRIEQVLKEVGSTLKEIENGAMPFRRQEDGELGEPMTKEEFKAFKKDLLEQMDRAQKIRSSIIENEKQIIELIQKVATVIALREEGAQDE